MKTWILLLISQLKFSKVWATESWTLEATGSTIPSPALIRSFSTLRRPASPAFSPNVSRFWTRKTPTIRVTSISTSDTNFSRQRVLGGAEGVDLFPVSHFTIPQTVKIEINGLCTYYLTKYVFGLESRV